MNTRNLTPCEVDTLNQHPARRRIIATERADGSWTMASSDAPLLTIENETFEDCYISLEEARELMQQRASDNAH